MLNLRKPPPPLPQPRHVPLAPSSWDRPLEDFGGHVMESSTGSWVADRHVAVDEEAAR